MGSSFVSEDFDIYSFKVILPIKPHHTSLIFSLYPLVFYAYIIYLVLILRSLSFNSKKTFIFKITTIVL